jgi:hypothetical protein
MNARRRFLDALMLTLALTFVPFGTPTVHAATIGSLDYAQATARGERIERIQGILARDAVRAQLLERGVEPTQVDARLAALTDAELALLDERIDSLPAGGDILAVIGIVFLVLLILELVGVTNVFSKI